MSTLFIIIIFLYFNLCQSARILGVIPTPSYSHQVVFQPLWKELSLRGHLVTVLTTNPINDPELTNLTEIDTSFSSKILTDKLSEIIESSNNFLKVFHLSVTIFSDVLEKQLEHPPVRQLIDDTNVQFDLVIGEHLMFALTAFSKRFNCPFIGVLSVNPPNFIHSTLGNPTHPVLYPDILIGEDDDLPFPKRVLSVLYEILVTTYYYFVLFPRQQQIVQKQFDPNFDLNNLLKRVSLVFINSNRLSASRPLHPSTVQIGGRPMRLPSKPLPESFKKLLDSNKNGFIYFSLGSNVNSKDIPEKTKNVILETFKELPYTVLWKYDTDLLHNKPDNVYIEKWIPQQKVLSHPNLKLFITHGGGQSMEEGIFARIPMLGMPFFVDQPVNIKKMVSWGFALSVDYRTLEKDGFKETILEVVNNDVYRKNVEEFADLIEDEAMTGLERAIWWTEYVLRHNGTPYVKNSVLDAPWYQYYLIDVISFLVIVLLISLYICLLLIRCLFRSLRYVANQAVKIKVQ